MNREDEIKQKLSLALRIIREDKGLSQEQLAEKSDLSRTYYGDLERGKNNISIVKLSQIACALEISIADICNQAEI